MDRIPTRSAPEDATGSTAPAASRALLPGSYRDALCRLLPLGAVVLVISALINLLMLTGSVYMLQVYDRVLSSGSVPTLLGLFAIVVVLYAFLGFYDALRLRLLARAALRLDRDLGAAAFGRGVGGALPGTRDGAEPLRDLDTVRTLLSGPVLPAVFDLPFAPLFLAVLFLLHPWLGWLTLAGAAIGAVLALASRLVTAPGLAEAGAIENRERHLAERARRLAETLAGLGMTAAVTGEWRRLRDRALARGQAGGETAEALSAASRAFRMFLQSAILTLGAFLVLRQEISAGMIVAASILSGRALAPVDQLIGQWKTLGRGLAAHRALASAFPAAEPAPAPLALPAPSGALAVRGLTKSGHGRPGTPAAGAEGAARAEALSEVSFELAPGDALGVIGASASGKSTLARLLVGVLRPDAGEIRFDGATPDQFDPAVLGRAIGYLPQQVAMLPGTIRENIARFDPAATDSAVIAAARAAGVHDMILALPQGYATRIGDSGEAPLLSGGQMQRLGLARALYGDPAFVVLDEPNAHLDTQGEAALAAAIRSLRARGASAVVMTHRAAILAEMSHILFLRDGRAAAFGTRAELLDRALGRPAAEERPAAAAATIAAPPLPTAPATAPASSGPLRPGGAVAAVPSSAGPRPPVPHVIHIGRRPARRVGS